jgi:hypothetical protein
MPGRSGKQPALVEPPARHDGKSPGGLGEHGIIGSRRLGGRTPARLGHVLLWLGFLAALGIAVLVIAEFGLHVRRERMAAQVPRYSEDDERFVGDPLLRRRNRPSHAWTSTNDRGEALRYTNNALGFRGRETTREKPSGVRRVIVTGGSTVYGALNDDSETLPMQLERILRERVGDHVEVINAGVPGYYALCEALYTRAMLLDFEPDAIVVLDGLNDVYYGTNEEWASQIAEDQLHVIRDGRFPEVVDMIDRTMFPRGLVEHQATMLTRTTIMRMAYLMGIQLPGKDRTPNDRVVALHGGSLGLLARYTRERGVPTIAALQPLIATGKKRLTLEEEQAITGSKYWDPRNWAVSAQAMYPVMASTVRASVEREGGRFLDLTGAFDAETDATYAGDAAHYTALGNRLLAEALAPYVGALLRRET